jgi:hypothetical protein
MVNTKFKTLTYSNGLFVDFVDEQRLFDGRGLYLTPKPTLHDLNETIEGLGQKWMEYYKALGRYSINFMDELNQCELKTVEIKTL